jgi:hypothetical protein
MNRTLLAAALACLAPTTQAITPSDNGIGSLLLFPFYTVNNGHDSLISLTNTSQQTKALRLRFRDSANGKEVLDFNLFLSPNDQWSAALSKNAAGGVTLKTNDTTCTVPTIPASGVDFRNSLFTERDADNNYIDRSMARTTEGSFEVIELGNVIDTTVLAGLAFISNQPQSNSYRPKNCNTATAMYVNSTTISSSYINALSPPSGGLYGSMILVNVNRGTSVSHDADAFNDVFATAQHYAPGNIAPDFQQAKPEALFSHKGTVYQASFTNGVDAVSAVLMRSKVTADWVIEPGINATTEVVYALSTKRFYTKTCGADADAPFTNRGFCSTTNGDTAEYLFYDSETNSDYLSLISIPPPRAPLYLSSAKVLTIKGKNQLSARLTSPTLTDQFRPLGKFVVDLSPENIQRKLTSLPANATRNGVACGTLSLKGLPVHGFAVNTFSNGNVGGVLSNYGNAYALRYERSITCE